MVEDDEIYRVKFRWNSAGVIPYAALKRRWKLLKLAKPLSSEACVMSFPVADVSKTAAFSSRLEVK